jgi:hypothetical protein
MASIVLNGDTSGSVTLSPPAVAGTQTVTLPAASGQLMVSGNMPAFSAFRFGAYQAFSQNTFTKAAIQSEVFDTNNCYDSTTNYRFTPTVAGYYQVTGYIGIQNSSTYTRAIVSIYKNGAEYTRSDFNQSTITYMSVPFSGLIYMNGTTDYIEVYVYSNASAPNVDYGSAPYASLFSAAMVRSA